LEKYLKDPVAIEEKSLRIIREETNLNGLEERQQRIVMQLVHTSGNPGIAQAVRISDGAVDKGIDALISSAPILCDVEMVKHGLKKRFLTSEPLCFLNAKSVQGIARHNGETRAMSALSLWQPYLDNSIVIIGNAPTALFRLIEMLQQGDNKPALVIGMPVGFVGASESKRYLWHHYRELCVECITIEGRTGGSALAAGAFNTLVRFRQGMQV